MEKSTEYVLQGYTFLLEKKKTLCRTQATLRDPVDADLLRQSLDALMRHTDYFHLKPICEDEQFFLVPNDMPCEVYAEGEIRQIPEETNGYTFYVSYQASTVFFTFWHFITDGRGSIRFMNELIREYCNRRYGTEFACHGLYTDPMFSLEALKERYGKEMSPARRENIPPMQNQEARHYLVRLSKDSVMRAAMEQNMWPFSYILYALSRFAQTEYKKDEVSLGYTMDMRDVIGVPNALYNCACTHWFSLNMASKAKNDILEEISDEIVQSMKPNTKAIKHLQIYQLFQDIYQSKRPMHIKQIQNDMVVRTGQAHLVLSYLDAPMDKEQKKMAEFIDDFQIILLTPPNSLFVSEVTWGKYMNLVVSSRFEDEKITEHLRAVFERENIEVCVVKSLDYLKSGKEDTGK